ncbi:unnamed protein product, partial [Meganyctiphanes norvegica]
ANARELYDFADQVRQNYDVSIPQAADFYKSWSGYGDELAWSAIWLYYATGENKYLDAAKKHWNDYGMGNGDAFGYGWDEKTSGVYVLMAQLGGDSQYRNTLQSFMDRVINETTYTPGGLLFLSEWGSLRHANNIALLAVRAADLGLNPETYRAFAKSQIDFTLGSTGRSFVVGYGVNPPQKPHHRS